MNETPLRIGLIYGSIREGRFCDTVAGWARTRIERDERFSVETIDPLTFGLTPSLPIEADPSDTLRRRLERADAFVVVTPEYNHGYPAALKALIDSAYQQWRAKPVGFVSYGGISGGLRAVEQLRLVFAELHAVTLRDSVSLANPWDGFDAAGRLLPEAPNRALTTMLRHLAWWARVLREARTSRGYAELVG